MWSFVSFAVSKAHMHDIIHHGISNDLQFQFISSIDMKKTENIFCVQGSNDMYEIVYDILPVVIAL